MDYGILGHKVASEYVEREKRGQAPLGRNSLYNSIRETVIDVLDQQEKENP